MKLGRRAVAAAAGVLLALVVAAPAHAETVRHAQWHLDALRIPEVQQLATGQGVTVAVIDNVGVDASHPDLAGQVLPGTAFGIDSPNGWSTAPAANHATGVAGVIAAKGGGDMHALGIAPAARILPIALSDTGGTGLSLLPTAIRWAVDHGAKVISMSIGTAGEPFPAEIDAVRYALDKDVVVVAAAGNIAQGDTRVAMPANTPGVIAVSGTGHNAEFWTGSVAGPEVSLSAPAVDIVTTAVRTVDPSGYQKAEGTSLAAPIVAGAAALVRSKFPNLNAASVINRLIATARDHGPPGRDPQFGFGTVRIFDALTTDVADVTTNPLGTPSASATASGAGASRSGRFPVGAVLGIAGGVLLLIVVVIVIVVVAVVRRRRRPPAVPAPPYGQPSPPYGQPFAPYGQPPPGQYPPYPPPQQRRT